jgi:hypothetical protein
MTREFLLILSVSHPLTAIAPAVGRTSPFSKPLFPILTVILLAGFLPGVRAACWFSEKYAASYQIPLILLLILLLTSTGNEQCDTHTLNAAARAAIALAICKICFLSP